MGLFSKPQQTFCESIEKLCFGNPFLPERIQLEKAVLGKEFEPGDPPVWSLRIDLQKDRPNVIKINKKANDIAATARQRLIEGVQYSSLDIELYEKLILYLVYYRCYDAWWNDSTGNGTNPGSCKPVWEEFNSQIGHFIKDARIESNVLRDAEFWFALLNQICRAFQNIFRSVIGQSLPAARLRADIWQSIFTHDLHRYYRGLYQNMNDVATLVTGPSGTGKELVANAIGASRFIPFDRSKMEFAVQPHESFHALNLSALSPTLIESELFGHSLGAYTGATKARSGWFEQCSRYGTVFLDEIGELGEEIQVKLLRVLQTRSFQRMGEQKTRKFNGKVVSATNRNLLDQINKNKFREDLYYRLCSDLIATPSLKELLSDSEEDLEHLVRFISKRVAGDLADEVCRDVLQWINENLPDNYQWPGNTRELEQCVRNVMIRGRYTIQSAPITEAVGFWGDLKKQFIDRQLTADELTRKYCTYVYWKTKSYQQTGEILSLDRRTIKAKVDLELLAKLNEEFDVKQ